MLVCKFSATFKNITPYNTPKLQEMTAIKNEIFLERHVTVQTVDKSI